MIYLIVGNIVAIFLLILVVVKVLKPSNTESQLNLLEKNQERLERNLRDEISKNREETTSNAKASREELMQSLKHFNDSLLTRITEIANLQNKNLNNLTGSNENRLNKMRETIEERLKHLQEDNSKKLEKMRETVDEKLHATLEKRLGESFKLVSERLELVHKGLGDMQNLAKGVGDLKNVLTNVKTRGTWGEIQLGNLLEQVLTPEQYESNVTTKKGSTERVEYAIKLPGRERDNSQTVLLPIDSKFPQEDYLKLIEAQESANPIGVETALKQIAMRINKEGKTIKEKYLDPPSTTDFAIMFLPSESLYAEVLRQSGLCEKLQREFRIIVTGPTTLAALLNSLQMGFRTLAIEKRSSEVWQILGSVKTEFGKFGDILDKTHKKIIEAGNTIELASRKSRTIERRLKNVQTLPVESVPHIEAEL